MHFRPTREHGEDNPNAIRTANVKYKSKKLLKHQPNTNSLSLQNICMDSSLRSPQCIFSMFLVTVLDVWIQEGTFLRSGEKVPHHIMPQRHTPAMIKLHLFIY